MIHQKPQTVLLLPQKETNKKQPYNSYNKLHNIPIINRKSGVKIVHYNFISNSNKNFLKFCQKNKPSLRSRPTAEILRCTQTGTRRVLKSIPSRRVNLVRRLINRIRDDLDRDGLGLDGPYVSCDVVRVCAWYTSTHSTQQSAEFRQKLTERRSTRRCVGRGTRRRSVWQRRFDEVQLGNRRKGEKTATRSTTELFLRTLMDPAVAKRPFNASSTPGHIHRPTTKTARRVRYYYYYYTVLLLSPTPLFYVVK